MRLDCGASESVVNSGTCAGDLVERVDRVLRIGGRDHDRVGAGGDKIVHQRVLQRGGTLRGIAELQFVAVAQFALRLLHAGFGQLPEVGRGVDDEGELLLFLGGCAADKQKGSRRSGNEHAFHMVLLPETGQAGSILMENAIVVLFLNGPQWRAICNDASA